MQQYYFMLCNYYVYNIVNLHFRLTLQLLFILYYCNNVVYKFIILAYIISNIYLNFYA